MEQESRPEERRLRFTLRGVLFLTMLVALTFGWYASYRNAQQEIRQLQRRRQSAIDEQAASRRRGDLFDDAQEYTHGSQDRVLTAVDLKGARLPGLVISAPADAAFQMTNFSRCDLQGASLTGGSASFQGTQFTSANLARAKLSGGGSAFQLASFAEADLSGALLTGGAGAFQEATFAKANLSGARLRGGPNSYQGANFDAARLEGADLSGLDPQSLQSFHFQTPPSYDDKTVLPSGFDAKAEGWRRAH